MRRGLAEAVTSRLLNREVLWIALVFFGGCGGGGDATGPPAPERAYKLALKTPPLISAANRAVFNPQPIIQLEDLRGNPTSISGRVVTVSVAAGGGTLAGTTTTVTDASGQAVFADLSLAGLVGSRTLSFTSPGLANETLIVTLTSGTPADISANGGDGQTAVAGAAVAIAPSVKVRDPDGNPVEGARVQFDAAVGNGVVSGSPVMSVMDGTATVSGWTLGRAAGVNNLVVHVTGLTADSVVFAATGVAGSPSRIMISAMPTSVQARVPFPVQPAVQVVDENDNPTLTPGVVVTAVIVGGQPLPGNLRGTTSATTDANGFARFSDLSLSGRAGSQTLLFYTGSLGSPLATQITLTAGKVAKLTASPDYSQLTLPGAPPDITPWLTVADSDGNGVRGVTVNYAVTAGGGSIIPPSVVSDYFGFAPIIRWLVGPGIGQNIVTAATPEFPLSVSLEVDAVNILALTLGELHTCILVTGGGAYCWGDRRFGQTGTDQRTCCSGQVLGGLAFSALVAGRNFTCGLVQSGAAYCWGDVAGANTPGSSSPVPSGPAVSFVDLAAGFGHVCGLTQNGQAYCWGSGLGVGDGNGGPVGAGRGFSSLAASLLHTCGVGLDELAYCWGSNTGGQLGDGTTVDHVSPTPVSGGYSFKSIGTGLGFSCGLLLDGKAVCWGVNSSGQLGDGSGLDHPSPAPVTGNLTFATLTVGETHSCGVTSAGQAYCWGLNSSGELGDGSTSNRGVPVPVAGGLSFEKLSAGGQHTCGRATGGAVYCWGSNVWSQLTLGTGIDVQVTAPLRIMMPHP